MGIKSRNGYEDVETISDPDGVVGVLSRRLSNGQISLAVYKLFERDGQQEKTSFLAASHFAGVRRILAIAEDRIKKLEPAGVRGGR
jgi:hypothetical protein